MVNDQPLIQQTPEDLVDYMQPRLDVDEFNKLNTDYGYNVTLENAIKCPCISRNMNMPLRTCISCQGLGWIFINKRINQRLVLQQMNRNLKYENWNEDNTGIVSITAKWANRLSVWDRITLQDGEDIFTENLNVNENANLVKSAFTIYDVKEVKELLLFDTELTPPKSLIVGVDYTVTNNEIILTNKYQQTDVKILSLSIRYVYQPQYLIIDIPRNFMSVEALNCQGELDRDNMPVKAIGRILHYMLQRK